MQQPLKPLRTMRISNKVLSDFAAVHPAANEPMQAWWKIVESCSFMNFAALKNTFNAIDRVADYYVFNVGGNKYRIVAAIHFNRQHLFVRHIFTHKEYDSWKP